MIRTLMTALAAGTLGSVTITARTANAQVILPSPDRAYEVGIDAHGSVLNAGAGKGFMRLADAFDPIAHSPRPREAWGVTVDALSGWADPDPLVSFFPSPHNLRFTPSGRRDRLRAYLVGPASGDMLLLDFQYRFPASNILQITTKVKNLNATERVDVSFTRHVAWRFDARSATYLVTADPIPPAGPMRVNGATYDGYQIADPLSASTWDRGVYPAGGTEFGTGAGFGVDVGILSPGTTATFEIFHAISRADQSHDELRAQMRQLGVDYLMSGKSLDGRYAAALAFRGGALPRSSGTMTVTATPEPATTAMIAIGVAAIGVARRRRLAR